jgi:hypothetical protein
VQRHHLHVAVTETEHIRKHKGGTHTEPHTEAAWRQSQQQQQARSTGSAAPSPARRIHA